MPTLVRRPRVVRVDHAPFGPLATLPWHGHTPRPVSSQTTPKATAQVVLADLK